MDTATLLKKVRKLEIKTKGIIKDLLGGDYHSAFKGKGMAFSEVREYSYGDDVRDIDWNVTARSMSPYIKIYEEERELTLILLIDVSPSTHFGTKFQLKSEMITEICAVLAFSALGNQDKVGAIFFTDKVEKYLPPKKNKQNILRIIRELLQFEPTGKGSDISKVLHYLNNVQKKKAICFLISDFQCENFEKSLTLAGKRHDLIGLQIYDEREKYLPDVGLIEVINPETQRIQILDTSSTKVREVYQKTFEKQQTSIKKIFTSSNVDFIMLATDQNYQTTLHSFFKKRAKR